MSPQNKEKRECVWFEGSCKYVREMLASGQYGFMLNLILFQTMFYVK